MYVCCAYACLNNRCWEYILEPNSGLKPNTRIWTHIHCMGMYAYSKSRSENRPDFSLGVSTHRECVFVVHIDALPGGIVSMYLYKSNDCPTNSIMGLLLLYNLRGGRTSAYSYYHVGKCPYRRDSFLMKIISICDTQRSKIFKLKCT